MIEVLRHAWLMTSQRAVGRQVTNGICVEIFRAYAKHVFGKEVLRLRVDTGVHTSTAPSWDLIMTYEYHVRKEVA